jgi:hypothetical protein
MKRRSFLRDALMTLAISLVPEILRPVVPEVTEDKEIEVEVVFNTYIFKDGIFEYKCASPTDEPHVITMKESEYYFLESHPKNKGNVSKAEV